jgi:hypothetical protein|tara:strand:+ start:29 stop:493 length:465 start_codon:yes stop_codon:yes gene_type:complete
MSLLDYILIGLAIIIPGGIPIYLLWRYQNKKALEAEKKLKKSVEGLTDVLINAAKDSLEESNIKTSPSGVKYKTAQSEYLSNAKYLTTLITTIVKKYGSVTLNEKDFADVTKKDYISLYIDMKTNDIILAANDYDLPEEIAPQVYETPEEDVYH